MRKGSMTREELDAYNQGLEDAWERFNRDYGHLVERDKAKELNGYRCPACNVVVFDDWGNFCSDCGQRLKRSWSLE